ncbi:BTB/POZ domain-containing protein [Senna tora]|uniref:BTB/POZ domain-containing protein n=1 Tax=Senna tora TaxID=362788 RepID=A0A834T5A6_9FABA|nr:BTB/POZ domain-containing protein [Senna tora]
MNRNRGRYDLAILLLKPKTRGRNGPSLASLYLIPTPITRRRRRRVVETRGAFRVQRFPDRLPIGFFVSSSGLQQELLHSSELLLEALDARARGIHGGPELGGFAQSGVAVEKLAERGGGVGTGISLLVETASLGPTGAMMDLRNCGGGDDGIASVELLH